MNIYNNNKQLLSTLGVEGNYSTDFEVRKAILTALGGDATECNTIYEVDTQILKIYEEGGGGSGSGKIVLGNDIKLGWSKFTEVSDYIDFSQTEDFSNMFYECRNLTSIPQLDTSKSTSLSRMFYGCRNLTSIPYLDTSKNTDFEGLFSDCRNLTSIPQLDFSNGTNFSNTFNYCNKLITTPVLNVSKGTSFSGMFNNCDKLENITFIGSINSSIDFARAPLTSYESVKSILTACSNTTRPTYSKTLKFNRTLTDQDGELAALISTCTSKGWTISGLTLN